MTGVFDSSYQDILETPPEAGIKSIEDIPAHWTERLNATYNMAYSVWRSDSEKKLMEPLVEAENHRVARILGVDQ